MRKTIKVSISLIIFSIFFFVFVHFTNNHKECLTVDETVYLENDSVKKTVKKHICKEKYNL